MKKILLAILGVAFALSFTSCDDQKKKPPKPLKHTEQKLGHRRW